MLQSVQGKVCNELLNREAPQLLSAMSKSSCKLTLLFFIATTVTGCQYDRSLMQIDSNSGVPFFGLQWSVDSGSRPAAHSTSADKTLALPWRNDRREPSTQQRLPRQGWKSGSGRSAAVAFLDRNSSAKIAPTAVKSSMLSQPFKALMTDSKDVVSLRDAGF